MNAQQIVNCIAGAVVFVVFAPLMTIFLLLGADTLSNPQRQLTSECLCLNAKNSIMRLWSNVVKTTVSSKLDTCNH